MRIITLTNRPPVKIGCLAANSVRDRSPPGLSPHSDSGLPDRWLLDPGPPARGRAHAGLRRPRRRNGLDGDRGSTRRGAPRRSDRTRSRRCNHPRRARVRDPGLGDPRLYL